MSAKKETLGKTVGVVLAVCLVCSIIVSGAAVGLRSLQNTNAALDKKSNILTAAGLADQASGDIAGTYAKFVEEKFVDLATGEYVANPAEGSGKPYNMYGKVSKADVLMGRGVKKKMMGGSIKKYRKGGMCS